MKIGVLSDTHIPKAASDLPSVVYDKLKEVDLILHAGDFEDIILLRRLEKIAEVIAVCGNMDSPELKAKFNQSKIFKRNGYKIGITHGYGSHKETIYNVNALFADQDLNIVVFGHTHTPCNYKINDALYFNPGSPTDKVFSPYNSFGIITISDEVKAEIIKIN